ncbi:MAG TPA: Hsp20/alpha crystallin family protein [Streptosporangiaceae bacterium]|nr:Hsp20/alpha crystallin family protein [Streptosporangiaceae bacterium]
MLLTSFDPFTAEVDRMFRRTFGPVSVGRTVMGMDAIRREDGFELRFDLPGIDPDSIDVTVDTGVLTVSARRSEEYGEEEKPFVRERVMGSFTRRVRLSDSVDADKIEAGYDRGVLTVLVPLAEKALPRKVEIKTDAKAQIAA